MVTDSPQLFIFGLGYSAGFIARRAEARGWQVVATTRDGRGATLRFDDGAAVHAAIRSASHILSSVPPDAEGADPVLQHYGEALALAPARWVGYLSSTGVYGDVGGAWVDESAPVAGRRQARNIADAAWQNLRGDVRVFRLPGIYGPGRSALDRAVQGTAHQVDVPGQVFSRIHVEDIAGAVLASFASDAAGVFNISDDNPSGQNRVMRYAAALLGLPPPPVVTLDTLSPMARAFYAENRRVANGRAKRLLGWHLQYPGFERGLQACMTV